jgi:hypothetical protein
VKNDPAVAMAVFLAAGAIKPFWKLRHLSQQQGWDGCLSYHPGSGQSQRHTLAALNSANHFDRNKL